MLQFPGHGSRQRNPVGMLSQRIAMVPCPLTRLQTLNSFLAVVDSGDVGLYVSVGGFTRDAEEAARKQTSRKTTLINAERLVELWIEAYDKLDQKSRQRLPLSPIYFLTPED
jgi:restriction system protein